MTFVRNERFPAYVFRDSVFVLKLSVQLYTCFRGRTSEALPLYMFPNYPRVIYFLLPRLCLRTFIFAVEYELCASDALTSFLSNTVF